MTESTQNAFHKLAIQGVSSMSNTFYWIGEALQHHIQEFKTQPELLARLAGQPREPIDLIARLERLRQDAKQLHRNIESAKRWSGVLKPEEEWLLADEEPRFEELSPEQVDGLKHLDEQLNVVAQHIQQVARAIDAPLAGPLADPADRLVDRNLDVKVTFHLREDDPAYLEDSDNLVAEVEQMGELSVHQGDAAGEEPFDRLANSWPDGYDCTFPMPHGGLMHELRLYSGYERGLVDYRDLLRIGSVWVDIVATHQYLYDLTTGRWIKGWKREEDGPGQPVYVRDT